MQRIVRGLVAALAMSSAAGTAAASTFDINLIFTPSVSARVRTLALEAEAIWESVITGYQGSIDIDQVNIIFRETDIDGLGGTLGSAGVLTTTEQEGYTLPLSGIILLDDPDVIAFDLLGLLDDIILHEIAHILGFGTLWEENDVYIDGTGEYTGANALATYRSEFDSTATYVPVELDGGPGTANAHWDEDWPGGSGALMTGFIEDGAYLTDTTIASFEDLGYTTIIPLPAPLAFMIGGLGALALVRRRRRAA
jgi:Leishmanolysin.